jgi:phosphate-selective porin
MPSFRCLAAQAPQSPIRVFGYVQPRFQSIGDSAGFLLRRARLGVEGNITPWARFRIQADFRTWVTRAAGSSPAVQATDLYIQLSHRALTATIGQYKVPFLYENIISSSAYELSDRTLAADDIAPFRDIGATVAWTAGPLSLTGAVMNGEGANTAANPDKRMMYVERAALAPARGLVFAAAATEKPDTTHWTVDGELKRGAFLARAAYLRLHRKGGDNAVGGYGLVAWMARPERLQLLARAEWYDPSDAISGDGTTAYTAAAQILFKGDDLKLQASYGIYNEQGVELTNNRFVVQMQARF